MTTQVKAQLDRVNGLYTKVEHLSEAAQDSTESSDAIKLAVSNLKSAFRTYDAESKILTGYYASSGKHCLLHTECVRRRDCSVDVGQVLEEFNTRLEARIRTRQSFDFSLSNVSTFNASLISSVSTEILHRDSTPLDEVEVKPRVSVHDTLAQPEPRAFHSVLTTMPVLNPTVSSFVPISITDLNRRFFRNLWLTLD